MELDGANVLVTGSAKRVGRRTALRLAESGANIAVHYRTSEEEARETAEELRGKGVEATTVQGNLSKIDEVESLVGKSASDLGGLDALVNNASIFVSTPVGETTREEWDSLIDVNLRGPYFCAQEAVERMDGEGKIVNIADWAGFRPYTEYVPYCISKAGVIAMTKGL
ncbi:MAG: SDR family NAD(P)-dependent oxidoreductase, partial [Halobacteria archaeon]|nr:SDR family NAD(P)-dependent oxidoreductase [Halobacteria archaeon]